MPRHVSTRQPRGQVIVIAALAMVSLIGGMSRWSSRPGIYQSARGAERPDAVANAGASVLSERLAAHVKDRFPMSPHR